VIEGVWQFALRGLRLDPGCETMKRRGMENYQPSEATGPSTAGV